MHVHQAVEDYKYAITGHTPRTQGWYVQKLDHFSAWCQEQCVELEELKPVHLRRYLDHLRSTPSARTGKPLSTYTIHGSAQVIKGFLHWCKRDELIEERTYTRIRDNVEMPKVEHTVIETFSDEQIKRLLVACGREESPALQVRARAIISLLIDTGIRAQELCTLTMDNLHLSPNDSYIKVYGKGRREREVGLGPNARQAIHRYVTRFRKNPYGLPWVFLGKSHQQMTNDGLDRLIYRLRDAAGVVGVRCSAHTFRHTFAVNYLMHGGDIYSLSRLLGHSTVSTTEIYLKSAKARNIRRNHISVLDRLW
jgi:site-specific recombinase XerD